MADGSVENIVGVIQTRDVLAAALEGRPIDLGKLCRKAPVIPDLMDAMDALAVLRSAEVPLALVHDEYGHLDGIVTPGSILAALAGTFAQRCRPGRGTAAGRARRRQLAGLRARRAPICWPTGSASTCRDERDYSTVAGFALSVLKHLPETGETFRHDGWSFEIVDMDGRKIDKLIASRPRRRPAESAGRSGRLELSEPLLEAVGVVAGEIVGLLDDRGRA